MLSGMAAPTFRPADAKAAVIKPNDSSCTVLSKLTQVSQLLSDVISHVWNDDGTINQDFLDQIGTSSSGLSAPTGLTATDDRTTDISVSWVAISGATSYSIYRGNTSDTSIMVLLASGISTTTYVDTGATADQIYWYSVKAHSSSQISSLSVATDGKRPSSASSGDPVIYDWSSTESREIVVPAGKTQMEVLLWGGGGSGGHKNCSPWLPIGGTFYPGGGGASGAFFHVTAVTVAAAQVFIGVVGSSGQPTYLFKTTAGSGVNAQANPGGNGGDMTTVAGVPGASPATAGSNSLGSGSTAGDSSVGNAGSGSTGGAAVISGGFSAGAGGNGNQTCAATAGANGRIRIIFT